MLVQEYNKLNKDNDLNIDKYLKTKTMQRLKDRGMFCGMDYVNIPKLKPLEYYSRYDHSQNVAYTAFKLSGYIECLAGLFHDVGTLSFAHVNSFKKDETLIQNDELNVKDILLQDEELMTYLNEDKIDILEVCDAGKYPVIDKEIPALCLDRVDGILTTCLIWQHTHSLSEITNLYNMLCYFENLNGMNVDILNPRLTNFNGEIVLSEDYDTSYEDFFHAINVYSKILLSKESRYMMKILGLTLNYYEDIGLITNKDLFNLSETEIIAKILDSKYKDVWLDVTSFDKVEYGTDADLNMIIKAKIRQANPLVLGQMEVCEIDGISGEFYRELNPLYEELSLVNTPLSSNLSSTTKRVLAKYQK